MLEIKRDWNKIPNLLTGIRLFLSPIPGILFWSDHLTASTRWWATWIFVAVAATDILDGYLARKRGEVTNLGKMMDPMVDKALVIFTLAAICVYNPFMWLPTMIIVWRESAVTLLRTRARDRGIVIAASTSGKIKMVIQSIAVALMLVPLKGVWLLLASNMMLAAVVVTLASWYDYYSKFADVE
jgi:CDP-diacylglycerol--glycerol-3-phosphate 3-phosphatidyltransferase